ncbi:MAG: hypothetical protein R3F10_11990 [Lysobacteraceae bacterium]
MKGLREQLRTLDQALSEIGFARGSGLGRAVWRGRWAGRECEVSTAPQRRTRYSGEVRYRETLGYRLRLQMRTTIRTQLYFVREGFARNRVIQWVYRLRRQRTVWPLPEALRGFAAVTIDGAWTQRFLAEDEVLSEVSRLLTEGATTAMAGSVYFAPTSKSGQLWYASPVVTLETLDGDRVKEVLDALERIAATVEQLPAPQVVYEASAFGRFGERYPWAVAIMVIGGGMALLAAIAGVVIAVVVALVVLLN